MHDLVIKNARIIDGTGAASTIEALAVSDGIIVNQGKSVGAGRREINADGLLLTPGWVDIHTHYDGQATWDPDMTPSSWHGVTTTVFGNCGVGFAPVRPGSEKYLINLMEGVEDIPESVLAEGLQFDWESFGEYLDVLDRTGRTMDIGAQVPHAALRFYVMGERGADHKAVPTEAEIQTMGELLEESLHLGALGFTTSRTTKHRAADGSFTPSLSAAEPELFGLARAMKRAGKGVIEVNSDFGAGDFERLRAAAEVADRPLTMLVLQVDNAPDLWRETMDSIDQAVRDGLDFTAQTGSRAVGVLMSLRSTVHPFTTHPAWLEMADLSDDERIDRLQREPLLRQKLVTERPDDAHGKWMTQAIERTFEIGNPVNLEPAPEDGIAARAREQGKDPFAFLLELLLANNGHTLLLHQFENYTAGDLRVIQTLLERPNTICGLADGGAHVGLICDSSSPTTLLSFWARDRRRGSLLPIEHLVHKQTQATARAYGLLDRGVIAPGYRADFNLIDFDSLGVQQPYIAHDLPAGGRRILQRSTGYQQTFVRGVEVAAHGQTTGERPGRLIRGAQSAPRQ